MRVSRDAPANPSATHRSGRHAQAVLEDARAEVADLLHSVPRNILFTSGATEANNLAILGLARGMRRMLGEPIPLIASRAEHPSALAPLRLLQQEGFPLQLLPLDANAAFSADDFVQAVKTEGCLLVAQWANNETGVLQPIEAIASQCAHPILWHCDAVQGAGKEPFFDALWQSTSLSLSGHKLGAPKGVGVLRLAEDAILDPIAVGGGQQRGLRSGTESPALAASFAHALRLALEGLESYRRSAKACCNMFLQTLRQLGLEFQENHCSSRGLSNTLHLSFPNLDGRLLLPACDADGLDLSAGAACSSGAALASPVLLACGMDKDLARASLRISFGPQSRPEETQEAAQRLGKLLLRLYEVAKR